MTALKQRSPYMDNVKAFLIICVVVGHFTDQALSGSHALKSLFVFIYSFHMPLFIFINGLFCKKLLQDKRRTFIRVVFFLALYVFLKTIIYFIRIYIGGEIVTYQLFTESGTPWYLFATAAFYFITCFLKNINVKFLLPFSILLALIAGYDTNIDNTFVLLRIIVFYPFFLLGYHLDFHKIEKCVQQKSVRILGIICIIGFAIGCLLFIDQVYGIRFIFSGNHSYDELNEFAALGPLLRLANYAISTVMCFAVLSVIPHMYLPLFSNMGQRTLAIYFFHRPILYILTYAGILEILCDTCGAIPGSMLWLLTAVLLSIILSLPVLTKIVNFEKNIK